MVKFSSLITYVFSLHCALLSWIASIFRFEPWLCHSYNFEIVHDILLLLADGTIMYDAYSPPMMWFRVRFAYTTRIRWCCLFSYVTSELWRDRLWPSLFPPFAIALPGEAVSIVPFDDKIIPSTFVVSCCIWATLLTGRVCQQGNPQVF